MYPVPTTKRFRRSTRLARAARREQFLTKFVEYQVDFVEHYRKILERLANEENWAKASDSKSAPTWIGESDPLTICQDALGYTGVKAKPKGELE